MCRDASVRAPRGLRAWSLLAGMLASSPACAALFSGDALDKVADVMAIVVLIIVPVVVIVVFWLVHVLPERFAEKRHHPQAQAIQVLCLLSLVFGGLLWPLAWLWAFTKPVAHKMAYGTEKHEHYFDEMHEKVLAGEISQTEAEALSDELDAMAARGTLPAKLGRLRERLDDRLAKTPEAEGAA
jgi:CBS domain containing-hemolysin-like protein